jgi:hypothetical protein
MPLPIRTSPNRADDRRDTQQLVGLPAGEATDQGGGAVGVDRVAGDWDLSRDWNAATMSTLLPTLTTKLAR